MSLAILVLKEGGGRPTTTGLLGSELAVGIVPCADSEGYTRRILKVVGAAERKGSGLRD